MKSDDKEFLIKLGQNIKKYRKLKKISQEKLAEYTNVHYTTIGKAEIGQINVSSLRLKAFANGLGVNVKDFFDF